MLHNGSMHFLLLVLLVISAHGLAGADEAWSRPLFSPAFDLDLEFRSARRTRGGWMHSLGATATFRETIVLSGEGSVAIGARAGFEQWFGLEPAPRRIFGGPTVEIAADSQFNEVYWFWPESGCAPDRYRAFPLQRSRMISARLAVGLDIAQVSGLSPRVSSRDDPATEGALRPWVAGAIGLGFVSIEPGYAASIPFGRSGVHSEAWINIGAGRPYWPFSGHVGYRFHWMGRFSAHFVSVGFQVAL
jgi:hypothetical protein